MAGFVLLHRAVLSSYRTVLPLRDSVRCQKSEQSVAFCSRRLRLVNLLVAAYVSARFGVRRLEGNRGSRRATGDA